jgi:hypothetical protein
LTFGVVAIFQDPTEEPGYVPDALTVPYFARRGSRSRSGTSDDLAADRMDGSLSTVCPLGNYLKLGAHPESVVYRCTEKVGIKID